MKKIVLMLLVAMIPFLTMAQKRSKKGDKQAVVQVEGLNANVEYMVIKGIEFPMTNEGMDNKELNATGQDVREMEMKRLIKPQVKLIIAFDFGNERNKEVSEMMRVASNFRSMAAAANAAAERGWEFVSANVLSVSGNTTHYYYMKRKK
ncbi:MAG TPA: hypothetical protein DCW83_06925 [Saprospirales bacterium]|nr:hypothetical protein [Saprospirales bacterium]